jgi:hypothetical protein
MSIRNGFRYAELSRGEGLCSPDTCDHCGRQNLKKTIKLITPDGQCVWFGVGCAARAMGIGLKEVKAAKARAESALAQQERAERQALAMVEDAIWDAFLNRHAPSARGQRGKQIEALGGYPAARALYREECAGELAARNLQEEA